MIGLSHIPVTTMTSEQVRATANAGFVPVATLAEADDADVEAPTPRAQVPAACPPAPIGHVDLAKLRQAAYKATTLYPGPIGATLAAELGAWADFGFRLGGAGPIGKLVDHILSIPAPEPETAVAA